MGSFYGNITLLDTDLQSTLVAIPRPAFAFEENGSVVVFAAEDDEGGPVSGAALSQALGCVTFSVGVHDDDIFFYEIHRSGELTCTGAVPDPEEYFGTDDDEGEPSRADPEALADAVGIGDRAALRAALEGDFIFATERHQAVVDALGLPVGAVGWGYRYLQQERGSYSGPALTAL